ncbi:putative DCC family thiol-disulfide oxidoreductase YuxK [Mycolicibacterium iranicum]|uniref:Putative DCC family thiol-disulfide oxidoreductase YuxK n=1 Tax=Mycolicibacterium iranicum TaxID=912594 RepID=A0A839PZC0_MYCIR|nr:DCC1-like thiol-disulfide oxidoreductase family protein [Mycolicibacterium iranicum]MBB2988837.1 putative DCC family thiol-disulfide oxidoreductase YuxK [Mycolicibacterium iranicum]
MSESHQQPVLLYDGICGFCNSAVQTILRLDPHNSLRFAALQGEFAEGVIERHPFLANVDSMVFVENPGRADEHVSVKSDAALRVAGYLGGPWRVLRVAGVIPAAIRDALYDGFARIRYRVFGTHDTCPIPAPEVRARFLS